jgi:3'(2'), 5'-bisphosphate nucleotidase
MPRWTISRTTWNEPLYRRDGDVVSRIPREQHENWSDVALRAALDAGEAILEVYRRDYEIQLKDDRSPLTEADLASHDIIVKFLEATGLPVLSEESQGIAWEDRRAWSRYWLIDPLDGTKEFIKKNGEFTVNIALVEKGRPVMGVVYAPVLQTLYYGSTTAGLGHGAWKCEKVRGRSLNEILNFATPCPAPHAPRGQALRVIASRSHSNEETRRFIADLEKEYGEAELVSSGSSLKLCMVAEGVADIYPRIAPTMEWDTAAAQAVVEAAGGRVVQYEAAVPAASYWTHGAGGMAQGEEESMDPALRALGYNKKDLLNPYFVVVGRLSR